MAWFLVGLGVGLGVGLFLGFYNSLVKWFLEFIKVFKK